MSEVRVLHQKDAFRGRVVSEAWLVDGISRREGGPLEAVGFTYVRPVVPGEAGVWQAPCKAAVQPLIDRGYPVIATGNGHPVPHGTPIHE